MIQLTLIALGTVFFEENFETMDRWTHSFWKGDESEVFVLDNASLTTTKDARFYAISASFDTFSNENADMFVQYTVSNPQGLDCGGGYLKLYPPLTNLSDLRGGTGETKYNIMFGPDICGSTRKTHLIFNYNNKNVQMHTEIACESDGKTHHYMFALRKNKSYEIYIDGSKRKEGLLSNDWPFLLPKMINDPSIAKPIDWIEDDMMEDVTVTKPDDWDNIPKDIVDPSAKQPEDWNEEEDGSWEPPSIPNPEYKGEWFPTRIKNPDYKGAWVHPQIDNPDFFDDPAIATYIFGAIGFEIWQVKSGSKFGSILITDDESYAYEYSLATVKQINEVEISDEKEENDYGQGEEGGEEEKDEL